MSPTMEELHALQRELEDFVETASIGLHWVGPDGTILWANEADFRLLGYARDEYVGRNIVDFHADPDVIADILRRLKAGERLHEYEARLRCKDGSLRTVLIDSSVRWDGDRFVHTRCFTRDITERRRAEQELAEARRLLARTEKLSALGTLVSGVAHEIRTPLTYAANHMALVAMRLDKAKRAPLAPDSIAELEASVRQALEGMERIDRLVRDLRRFTKAAPGDRAPARLREVVAEAVDLFGAVRRPEVRVETAFRDEGEALLDRVAIQQVVLNLLQNAADAMPGGGVVVVETAGTAHAVELTVRDGGGGIPVEARPNLFEPFHTTKPEGLGLGLSIVQRVLREHGGVVEYETSPAGTTFRVRVPRAHALAAAPTAERSP